MKHSAFAELLADYRNFLLCIKGDMHRVKNGEWSQEQFAVNMSLKVNEKDALLKGMERQEGIH